MDYVGSSLNLNKHLKEEFVSNLTGSSMFETSIQMMLLTLVVNLRHSMSFITNSNMDGMEISLKRNDGAVGTLRNLAAYIRMIFFDFIITFTSWISFLTVLSEWTCFCFILLAMLLCVNRIKSFGSTSYGSCRSLRDNVSSYRISMTVLTCLCILAVDFKIFPRRYAKTETYGTSLMDLGVGSFVLANSLVSQQARNISSRRWMLSLKSTTPLLLLGIGRLAFTSNMGYQVHVGEYGVHWNFFFTLSAVSMLTSLINAPIRYSGILGSLILVGYQICLVQGLSTYLISSERKLDIISQNKEGIFSTFGYWGLYLIGVQLGNYLFFSDPVRSSKWARNRVFIFALLSWFLTVVVDRYVEKISRRMCNLGYVTFVLAMNFQVLGILMLAPGSTMLVLERAFGRNLLGIFLVANVLTGFLNLCLDTMSVTSAVAFILLHVYALLLCVFAGVAHFYNYRFKFWAMLGLVLM